MAHLERRRWDPRTDLIGMPRRAREGCDYDVYVADQIAGREFLLNSRDVADVAEAERAITKFDINARALSDTEALARLLLRAESVASSKIEGLEVGVGRLLRADALDEAGEPPNDITATEVLGNIRAMEHVLGAVRESRAITPEHLQEAHHRLFTRTTAKTGGSFRTEQNWIGGSDYNPCSAAFVPPPPELVEALVRDLCAFCNEDGLAPVAQAAIAHAQFETIHPFEDGNGRVGRALIQMIFRRRGITTGTVPPVSLVLATMAKDYVRGLNLTRYEGAPNSASASEALSEWVGIFAAACTRAVADAETFEERIREIQRHWRQQVGVRRSGSATDLIIDQLPGAPILTVASAAQLVGRSVQAANEAILRLVEAQVLTPRTLGKRRRNVFEARDIVTAFTEFERQLASPDRDTRISRPVRPVPHRVQG